MGLCLLMSIGSAKSQVTIGSNKAPNKGALLDFKDETASTTSGEQTASKGLRMPRVGLTKIKPTTDIELAASIGNTTGIGYDLTAHTGLLVYSIKEDACLVDPVYEGLYVWTSTQWQYLGQKEGSSSSEVHYYSDTRPHGGALVGTTQTYPYRNFGTAGDWMLENMRYIPDDGSFTASVGASSDTDKNYIYPLQSTPATDYDKIPPSWSNAQGLLYSYSAATLGVQDGVGDDQGQPTPTPTIQGICPSGWHIPSDEEWNVLEKVIYNNAETYSTYSAAELADVTIWDPISQANAWQATWNTQNGNRGSSKPGGHGLAMISLCNLPDTNWSTSGKSLSTRQGGFDVLLVGYANSGSVGRYGHSFFWSASSFDSSNAWVRYFGNGNSQVNRRAGFRYNLFSVRCKKD